MPDPAVPPVPLARYLLEVLPNEELLWRELVAVSDPSGGRQDTPQRVQNLFRFERVLVQALAFLQRELLLSRLFGELDRQAKAAAAAAQAKRIVGPFGGPR